MPNRKPWQLLLSALARLKLHTQKKKKSKIYIWAWIKTRLLTRARGIIDSHLWIRDMPPKVFPYVCAGKPYVYNVYAQALYIWKTGNTGTHVHIYTWRPLPNCSKQHCREYACIVWLYHACSYTVGPKKAMNLAPLFEDIWIFFFFFFA